MKKIFILASFVLLLTSCSSELKYHMSNHKFLTPETKGKFLKGDIGLAYQENQKVVLANAYDYLIFNLPASVSTATSIRRSSDINLPITLGMFRRLDFYTVDSTYGLKFQFVGSSELERELGWKAAIALGYGYEHNDSSSLNYSNGTSVRNYNTDIKVKNYDVSLIFGKRFTETFLLYLSLMRDYYNYKGALSSTEFPSLNTSGHSVNIAANIGGHLIEAQSNHPFFVKIEAGIVDGKLDQRESRTAGTFGGDVGWSW